LVISTSFLAELYTKNALLTLPQKPLKAFLW